MIGIIINAVLSLVITLVNLILMPIDLVISKTLPDVSLAISSIGEFFDYVNTVVGYAVDASGLTSISMSFIVSYWVFVIGGTLSVSAVKLGIKWFKSLKL